MFAVHELSRAQPVGSSNGQTSYARERPGQRENYSLHVNKSNLNPLNSVSNHRLEANSVFSLILLTTNTQRHPTKRHSPSCWGLHQGRWQRGERSGWSGTWWPTAECLATGSPSVPLPTPATLAVSPAFLPGHTRGDRRNHLCNLIQPNSSVPQSPKCTETSKSES